MQAVPNQLQQLWPTVMFRRATTFSGEVYVETQVIEVDATILDHLPLGRFSVLFIETGRDEIHIPTSNSAKRAQCERDES